MFVAQSMAEHEESVLMLSHLQDAIASKEQFYKDFKGAGAASNIRMYL